MHFELFDLVPWCLLHDRPRVCSHQEVLLEVAVNVMAEHKWSSQIQRQHARSRYPLSSMWSIPCRCSLTDSAVSAERHVSLRQVLLPRQGLHRHPPLLDVDSDASCNLSHHSGAHLASSELDTSCLVFKKALGGPRSSGTMNSMFNASEVGFTAIPP